jgi:hypothetical protein
MRQCVYHRLDDLILPPSPWIHCVSWYCVVVLDTSTVKMLMISG